MGNGPNILKLSNVFGPLSSSGSSFSAIVVGSGGLSLGGSSSKTVAFGYTISSGLALRGVGVFSQITATSPTGGLALNGNATFNIQLSVSPLSGLTLGGSGVLNPQVVTSPASVAIVRVTGPISSPVTADITSINTRANTEDAHTTAGITNSIQIPPPGNTNYSYWVTTQLKAVTAPAGTINNIRWFAPVSNTFSGNGSVNCYGYQASSYVQANGYSGTTGIKLTTASHAGLVTGSGLVTSGGVVTGGLNSSSPPEVHSFQSNVPLSINGSISATTGAIGNYMIYQLSVGASATPGTTNPETFTWKYDET